MHSQLHWMQKNVFVFSWDGTSTPVGTQYLNFRPGVSVIEMQTWGLSICAADLGSQYFTIDLGSQYLKCRPGISLLGLQVSISLASNGCQIYTCFLFVSFSSNIAVPKFKTYHFLPRIFSFIKEMLSHLAHKASLPTEQICSRHASLCLMQL